MRLYLSVFLLVLVAAWIEAKSGVQKKCTGSTCQCFTKKGGKAYGGVSFPSSESYNCAKKPKKCQKARFTAISKGNAAPECDSKGRYQPKQCGEETTKQVAGEGSGTVKLQSKNYPNTYFGTEDGSRYKITSIPSAIKPLTLVSPGLNGQPGTVSFYNADTDKYLRHKNFVLYLESNTKDNLFLQDATFIVREDKFFPGYAAIESVNYPGRFIRHFNYMLVLLSEPWLLGKIIFRNDASFKMINQAAPPTTVTTQECWCVTSKGKELKNTRGDANVSC